MPVYDYLCNKCKKRFQNHFTYREYGSTPARCTHCGSEDVRRKIGRVRVARSSSAAFDSLESMENLDQEDPRALASMMRSMSREMGEDLPPDVDEMVDRLEAGEDPEAIEKDLPLGDGDYDF